MLNWNVTLHYAIQEKCTGGLYNAGSTIYKWLMQKLAIMEMNSIAIVWCCEALKKSSIMKYMKDEYNQWLHTKDQTVSRRQSLMLITDSLACVYFNGFFKNPYSSQVNFNKSTTNIKYIYGFYKTGWSNSVFISSNFIYL